jgi:hypothetical protein
MDRAARWLVALVVFGCLAGPLAADSGEADRLLKEGFPDRDYTRSPIKLMIAGQKCVLAATAWEFDKEGRAILTDAAVVHVRTVGDRQVVEVASGKSATVSFDPPVTRAEELGKSKIVSVETSDGRVIRFK